MSKRWVWGVAALVVSPVVLTAAEITVVQPVDRTVLSGVVEFRLKPSLAPGESFLSNPEVAFQDEYGREVQRLGTTYDQARGYSWGRLDTSVLKDGLYLVEVKHRVLAGAQPKDIEADLMLGVRNGRSRPARFTIEYQNRPHKTSESCEVTVRVFDERGRRLPASRVAFEATGGSEVDTPAEITDSDGEARVSLSREEAGMAGLRVTVESLAAQAREVRFAD